ncbi:MAG: hypothetical protein Q8M08_14045 [Bacteroidales bacterium]|nr:hypothetical protein [Bacteroidales bacterium]
MKKKILILLALPFIMLSSCKKDKDEPMITPQAKDPNTAVKASIDRFSATAGHLFMRDATNGLPAANMAINFDMEPFITQGLGPNGSNARYYNFDVQSLAAAPIYVLFRTGETTPVAGQLNIVDVIPGDAGYNDFWRVNKVTVPAGYVANVVTSYQEIVSNGYSIESTTTLVNCPVVPEGSTANLRYTSGESNQLVRGWYKGKVVFYFSFFERDLMLTGSSQVPVADILVTFNINPDLTGGGPPSGFKTEPGTMQTHNVLEFMPEQAGYSPLWDVDVYNNTDFGTVMNWQTASAANIMAMGVALVNCPVVWKQ